MLNDVFIEKEKYLSKSKAVVLKAYIQQPVKSSPQKVKSINEKVKQLAMSRRKTYSP